VSDNKNTDLKAKKASNIDPLLLE